MKKLVLILVAATALVPMLSMNASAEKKESIEVSWTAQSISTTQIINVSPYERFSAQAIYGSGNGSTHTLTSGGRAASSVTVTTDYTQLIATQASVQVNIFLNSGVSGDAVTLNGIVFKEGTNWSVGASSIASAAALATKIDAHPDFAATSLGSTVTVRYAEVGVIGNGLPVLTTDATNLAISAATMTGGINRNTITINGITLTEGSDFIVASSSLTTASNIMAAINANATLSAQVIASTMTAASTATAIVNIKALNSGRSNYSLSSSTSGFATSSGFPNGYDSDVNILTDVITKTSHGLTTGLQVLLSTAAGNLPPTGLISGTTYFAIKLNENQYALATTQNNAIAGTKIDITDITPGSVASMYPTPLSLGAGNGFYWSFSNDGVNFTTSTAVNTNISSVTYSASGSSVWDFGNFNYKYIAVNFLKPTAGAIALTIRLFGKKD